MDNLCHTLVGAALAKSGLERRTALGAGTLMIAANFPDIDALAVPFGDIQLDIRRGWTHGVLAMLVLPFVLTALVALWHRVVRKGVVHAGQPAFDSTQLFLLSLIGILSHPALDWMNTYGVRLLMPMSREWFFGDTLFIVDPWLLLALGAGTWWSWRARKSGRPRWTWGARAALAVSVLYIGAMRAMHDVGEQATRAELALEGAEYRRLMVAPEPANPLTRAILVDEGETYRSGTVRFAPQPVIIWDPRAIPVNEWTAASRAAARTAHGARFLRWARFPFFVEHRRPDGRADVWIGDARYVRGERNSWASVTVTVDP
jgi:inner membrane protein